VAVTTPTARPTTVTKPPVKTAATPKAPVPHRIKLTLTATRDGSYVTLRNFYGLILFQGLLGPGSSQTVVYPGTIRVSLVTRGNITVAVDDQRVNPKASRFLITPTGAIQKTN
jgi:hypothetical protein